MADTTSRSLIQLPVIDISNPTPEAGKQVLDAATKYGFLYVDSTTTEISSERVDSAFKMVVFSFCYALSSHLSQNSFLCLLEHEKVHLSDIFILTSSMVLGSRVFCIAL